MKRSFHEERVLTGGECDALIELWNQDHGHGKAYRESKDYISKRTSVVDMPKTIFKKIHRVVQKANKENWDFDGELDPHGEIYRYEPGDFFDWHMDLGAGRIERRKLTTLIQLSKAKDYTGGRLELFGNEPHTASKRRGTLLIYPAFLMHRVTKVKKGLRYSIGGEFLGDPFR